MIDIEIWAGKKRKETHGGNGGGAVEPYADEATHAERADKAGYAESAKASETAQNAERAERAKTADEAIHAKNSDEVSLESKTLARFIRKDVPGTAKEVITFLKGIIVKAVSYFEGIVNRGDISNTGDIHNTGDITNAGDITTKNLTVTDKATFFELEMQKAKAAGGMSVYSPGAFHIDEVVDAGNYYACYQRAEQDGVKLRQMCDVDDQLMCARFNVDGNGNKFYWMRVAYASPNTVQRVVDGKFVEYLEVRLDKSVKAKNCQGVPEVGDALAVFGNRTKEERQSVIVISAYNSFDIDLHAPYIAQYEHVNDFNLKNKKTTWLSKGENHLTGTFTVVSGGKNVSLDDFVTKISQATFKVEADKITARIDGVEKALSDTTKNYSELQITLNSISSTVARKSDLEDVRTKIKQTAEEINLTVNNGTRPNLLWGSDLDLSGVQDVINRAYAQGDIIKEETEKKAEWKRSRDNAGSDDDRIRYQEGMDDCDREIAQAQGEVAKCKAAIAKHLGVGLNATKVDNTEWFEYLKGGGVGGADAIKAKVAAVNGEGNYYAGLYWQIGFGSKSNVKVKPNTKYTFSFWIRTEILQGRGYAVAESFNMESLTGGRKGRTMPWTTVPAKNEWERMSYTFTTGATGYIMVGVGLSGEDNFSELIYLCHPKLEEGEVATPWCAYDGTVDALLAGGFDIKNRRMEFTTDNFVIRNNKGEVTVGIDRNGMMEFYGKDKEFPGIRFGVNEQGEMVLEFWRRGVKLYDLGPDNVFNKLDNVKSVFTPMHLTRVKIYNNSSGERCVMTDILYDQYDNPEGLPVFRFSEGYKLIGGARRYNISGTETPSGYDGRYFFGSVKEDLSFALFGDMMKGLKYAHGTFVSVDDAAKIDRMARNPIKQVPNTTIEVIHLKLGFKSSSVETIGGGNGEVTIADDKPTVDIPGLPPGWKPPHFEH